MNIQEQLLLNELETSLMNDDDGDCDGGDKEDEEDDDESEGDCENYFSYSLE